MGAESQERHAVSMTVLCRCWFDGEQQNAHLLLTSQHATTCSRSTFLLACISHGLIYHVLRLFAASSVRTAARARSAASRAIATRPEGISGARWRGKTRARRPIQIVDRRSANQRIERRPTPAAIV